MNIRFPLLLVPLVACGPSQDQLKNEFLSAHPAAVVLDAGVGEGDSDNALWCVRYHQPPDTSVFEQVWLVQKDANGEWQVTDRDSSLAKGKICERAT